MRHFSCVTSRFGPIVAVRDTCPSVCYVVRRTLEENVWCMVTHTYTI